MKKTHTNNLITIFLLILCASLNAVAQTGTIKGILKNSVNHPVAGVNIYLEGTGHNFTSNEDGSYLLNDIPAGNYTLVVKIISFNTERRKVIVAAYETINLNISLIEDVKSLEAVTITASGIKKDIQDVPSTINVIGSKQIQESGAQSVGQIITRIPGVNYLDEDGRGLKPNIGLRGLDPLRNRNLLVLIDGKFPIGMTYYGDPAAYYMIPVENVERIEVMKGASPVLYGGYSVGGVINMITKTGLSKPETRINLGYGSFNALNAQISTGGSNEKFNYYVSAVRRQGDGYRDRSKYGINDFSVKLGAKVDPTSEISFYLNGFYEDSETPGGLTQEQFDNNPRQTQHQHDHFYGKRFSGALSYNKSIARYHNISASIYGNYFERNWWITYAGDKSNGYLRDIHAIGAIVDYTYNKEILGKGNSLIAGVRVHTDRLDDINIQGVAADARSGALTGSKINTSMIYEGFIYDEFNIIDNLIISPGIRYTSVKYKREDHFLPSITPIDPIDAFVYSLGAIYKFGEHSRVYGTFSKGFQPPALNSVMAPGTIAAGVDLKPETSMNFELGVRTNPVNWLSLNLATYQMHFKDKVISESGINKNKGKSFHRGVEAELELGPWNGLSFFVNGALQKATFADGEDEGKILPNAPQQITSAGVRYKLSFEKSNLVFNIYDTYVGKQYSDSKNIEAGSADGKTGAVPAYNVLNATINYSRSHWGIYFNLHNILNEKYYTLRWASWNGIIPSPSRNFMAGVNFKF